MKIKTILFDSEFTFKTSRSSGAGGQNVNKVSSKVELDFDVKNSTLLTDKQKEIIFDKLSNKISKNGILQIVSQTERSQLGNKEIVVKKFYEIVYKCFVIKKKRKVTLPTKSAVEKRLTDKKRDAEVKKSRKKISDL
jgi:ribosome-associated protein